MTQQSARARSPVSGGLASIRAPRNRSAGPKRLHNGFLKRRLGKTVVITAGRPAPGELKRAMEDKCMPGNASERIQKMIAKVGELAEGAQNVTATELGLVLEKITQAFKSLSEMEKAEAETRKLAIDEKKSRYDLDHASRQEKAEKHQRYISVLTPLVTMLVLALTLVSQTYQFVRSERDKQEALEDSQWSEAVKTISQSAKLSPIAISLNPFLKSKRYAAVAKKTAIQALSSTHDSVVFNQLFSSAFAPVDWGGFDAVLQLDRGLGSRLGELYDRTFIPQEKRNDMRRLTEDEKREYEYVLKAIKEISVEIGTLLKGPRPRDGRVDLRSGWFSDCDWSGVNLYAADLDNVDLRGITLKGADLGGISSFQGAYMLDTAWWDAGRVSPALLQYLIEHCPYDPNASYGHQSSVVSSKDYNDSIARLKSQ